MNLQKLYELRVAEKKAGDFISTLPTLDYRRQNEREGNDHFPNIKPNNIKSVPCLLIGRI